MRGEKRRESERRRQGERDERRYKRNGGKVKRDEGDFTWSRRRRGEERLERKRGEREREERGFEGTGG
jgi:hypothetical protein